MKIFIILIVSTCTILGVSAQVIIGTDSNLIEPNEKILLSFTTKGMGIVLPIISNKSVENRGKIEGAIFTSFVDRQVKIWTEGDDISMAKFIGLTSPLPNNVILPTLNDARQEGLGVVIGEDIDKYPSRGVLELRSSSKTLVLPSLGTADNPPNKFVKSPYIGTIGFSETRTGFSQETRSTKGLLWVYGGGSEGQGQWHLWASKPDYGTIVIDEKYFDTLP